MNIKAKIAIVCASVVCATVGIMTSTRKGVSDSCDSENSNTNTTIEVVTDCATTNTTSVVLTTTAATTTTVPEQTVFTATSTTLNTTTNSEMITTVSSSASSQNLSGNSIYYTEKDVINLAKLMWVECGGVPSMTERACVAWTVCNHVDYGYSNTITGAITYKGHFAFRSNAPVVQELYDLASDVLSRWAREKNGESSVGRVLPLGYTYFYGDGKHNYFHNGSRVLWDYSLPSPYNT